MIQDSFLKSFRETKSPFITNPYRFAGAAASGGWVELARTTLGSNTAPITVSSIPDKRYYMILAHNIASGNVNWNFRVGTGGTLDTGSNYADRHSQNGAGDNTTAPANRWGDFLGNQAKDRFTQLYISNLSGKEKLMTGHVADRGTSTGAGSAPERVEVVGKWTNTSLIDILSLQDDGSDNMGTGSEMVVLGWDPADTHTTNFWEELASVELGSDSSSSGSLGSPQMETGTFTAKKYLWVQGWIKSSTDFVTNFNSNSSSIFSHRYSDNGGSDGTSINSNSAWFHYGGDQMFVNAFIINDTSKEKLMINHIVYRGSSGAGTAPQRREIVSKWANTSDQITSIQLWKASMTISAGSTLKVWGSD